MNVTSLRGRSVFPDTTVLVFAFAPMRYTGACEQQPDSIRDGVAKGQVNSTVINEFLHKVLPMLNPKKGLQPAGKHSNGDL